MSYDEGSVCVSVVYQTVGVFGSRTSGSALHVAAVAGEFAFTPLAARSTFTPGHFEKR